MKSASIPMQHYTADVVSRTSLPACNLVNNFAFWSKQSDNPYTAPFVPVAEGLALIKHIVISCRCDFLIKLLFMWSYSFSFHMYDCT